MKYRIRFELRTLFLVALMAVSLVAVAGCGGDDDAASNGSQSADTSGATEATDQASLEEKAKKGQLTEEEAKRIEEENFSEEPPPIQILTNADTGYRVNKPTVVIVQSNSELKALKKKHFSNGVKRQEIAPIGLGPDKRQLVAVIMPQDKAGALVAVNDVHEEDGKIVVTAVRLLPGKGCESLGSKVRPVSWVETRAMEGEPKLVVETQRTSPCTEK